MSYAFSIIDNLDKRSSEVLGIIQKNGPISRAKLASITKLKVSSLNKKIETLMEHNFIVGMIEGELARHKKPSLFSIDENNFYLIGVDVSRVYIQVVITNLAMKVLWEKTVDGSYSIDKQGEIIIKTLKKLMTKNNIDTEYVIGIGIGVVIPINKYKQQDDIGYLKELIKSVFRLPVFIDNGANLALLAEYNFGIGKDRNNLAYVHCGGGIRSAVISNGNIVRTINNSEDAFGHMIVQRTEGEICSCGNHGCVESYASIAKIVSKYKSRVKMNLQGELSINLDSINYTDICNLADKDDNIAKGVLEEASGYLGTGLANFIKLMGPEMVIMNGPLVENSNFFYENSVLETLRNCSNADIKDLTFCKGGHFESKSIAIGAAFLVFDELLKNNFQK